MALLSRLISNIPKTLAITNNHVCRHMTTATNPNIPAVKTIYNGILAKGYPTPPLFTPTRDTYLLRVDWPGINNSDLKFSTSGSRIFLSAQEPKTHPFGSGHCEPRFYEVDVEYDPVVYSVERAMVEVRNGVLWVRVPKIQIGGPDGVVVIRMGRLITKVKSSNNWEIREIETGRVMDKRGFNDDDYM